MIVRPGWIGNNGVCIALAPMLLLVAMVESVRADTPPGYVDASSYGYNTTDATAALQAAIDTGLDVFVPNMGTDWYITPISLTNNNQKILFESGTMITAKPGAFNGANDSLFRVQGKTGVSLIGPGAILTMQQDDYTLPPYPRGEWRHGILLWDATDCTIDGLTIKDTGGDGIYVGAPAGSWSRNITIKNVAVDNAYRNGIAVTSVDGLLIDNSLIVNTSGTLPKTGIDFEPNSNAQKIANATVRNTIVNANNGEGITFQLSQIVTGYYVAAATGCSIENVTIVGNKSESYGGITLTRATTGLTIKDSLIANNECVGFVGFWEGGGPATGEPRNEITYSDFSNNTGGDLEGWVAKGTGCVTAAPMFYSTDINSPYYMYLDPSCSSLITQGDSDGGFMGARPVYSGDRTWTNAGGGSWSSASNWSGGVAASGPDVTADFSTLDITSSITVTLDGPRTIGHLVIGDTTVSNGWTLSGSTLTMDTTTGSAPTITSNDWIATIKSQLAGNDGLTTSGVLNWQVVDTNYNTITGPVTVADGLLKLTRSGTSARFFQGTDVSFVVESGATLENAGARNTFTDGSYDPIPITLKGGTLKLSSGDLYLNNLSMNIAASAVINNSVYTYVSQAAWTVEASASGSTVSGSGPLTLINSGGVSEFNIDVARGTEDADLTIGTAIVDHASYPGAPVVKKGDGILALTGANSYAGNTVVAAGTLSISNAYLSDTADIFVVTDAFLNLGFIGADTIDELYINGKAAAVGTWGALGSAADYNTPLITGTGLLNVLSGTWTPMPGDANGDGAVDNNDAAILAANWLSTSATWSMGDFNDDDAVDGLDATLLAANWQGTSSASVPEPGTLALLLTAVLSLVSQQRARFL